MRFDETEGDRVARSSLSLRKLRYKLTAPVSKAAWMVFGIAAAQDGDERLAGIQNGDQTLQSLASEDADEREERDDDQLQRFAESFIAGTFGFESTGSNRDILMRFHSSIAGIAALSVLLTAVASAAEPLMEKVDLWKAGEGGYKTYRIPGIVVTKVGTILAYTEARRHTGGDWDTIDVVLRRSTDGGKTFAAQRVIAHSPDVPRSTVALELKQGTPDDVTYDNPVMIADKSGAVHFLFCREYMRVFYTRSDDDGQTFSSAVDITPALDQYRPGYAWRVVATGPGHGVQLAKGRLIVPIWLALGTGGNGHHPSVNSTIYSDDDGKTWHRGDIAVPNSSETPDPNETTAVQLANGPVMLNVRVVSDKNRRVVVTSKDGAHSWSAPRFQDDLPDPICFASIVRLSTRKKGGKNRILFSNPDNLTRADGKTNTTKDRRNLTISLSYDEGQSWPLKKTLEPGSAGYSDLAVAPDGAIWDLYESGGAFPNEKLVLARFNLSWVTDGKDSWEKRKK